MAFDFSKPMVSKITANLDGVAILLYGANGVGKTPVAVSMEKPYYLAFESGITNRAGVNYAPMKSWRDFLDFVKWATNPKTIDEAKSIMKTVVLDTVENMADYCIDYTCARYGVQALGETRYTSDGKRDGSVNLYKEYEREFKRATRSLRLAGFTLVYIAHDGGYREEIDPTTRQRVSKIYPSGDKRAIEPVANEVDVIGYMQAAPLDANGNPVFSTIYFAPNNQFHARSRYSEIVPFIERVTAKSLTQAIIDAKQKELEKTGGEAASFNDVYQEEQERTNENAMSFEELQNACKEYATKLYEAGRLDEYKRIVEAVLGKGASVQETDESQIQALETIVTELKELDI